MDEDLKRRIVAKYLAKHAGNVSSLFPRLQKPKRVSDGNEPFSCDDCGAKLVCSPTLFMKYRCVSKLREGSWHG